MRVVDHVVVNGVSGHAELSGTVARNLAPGELFVSYRGVGASEPLVARTQQTAEIALFKYVDVVRKADRKADGSRDHRHCRGESPPALSLTKYAAPEEIDISDLGPGEIRTVPVEYVIEMRNIGGTPITDLTLIDALPRGFRVYDIAAENYARTVLKTINMLLTFWIIYPMVEYFAEDSSETDFNHAVFDVIQGNGQDYLVIRLGMREGMLRCEGNRSSISLRIRGGLDVRPEGRQ